MRDMKQPIHGDDHKQIVPKEFDVLYSDDDGRIPVIGLMVTPAGKLDEKFIMPMTHECAAGLIKGLVRVMAQVAPHLLLGMVQEQ
jgi:hypothetical protein